MRFFSLHVLVVLWCSSIVRAGTFSAPHVGLNYAGIDDNQAQAIANTLAAARDVYTSDFALEMPEQIVCDVKCAAGQQTRLYTDGVDHVFLQLSSKSQLDQPSRSGVFNLYGMCHELGHIAMYRMLAHRDWMTTACAEGWAHYAGSVVVDRVYQLKGESLWPDKYDYRQDGTARLDRMLAGKSPSEVDLGAQQWRKLEAVVGRKGFRKLFEAWDACTPEGLSAATVAAMPERTTELEAWWKTAEPIFVEQVQASGAKRLTIDKSRLSGAPLKLELDDNTSDGMKSIAGGGHARKFAAPAEGNWYVVAVSVFGSRYGRPQSNSSFDVALCDVQNRPIAQWSKPFSLFPYGKEGKWVRIELPPTQVPKDFTICLNFRPTATNGVYVNFDSSAHGKSSVAVPGKDGDAFEQGEWMIRVELDQAKGAGVLQRAESTTRPGN